MAAQGICGSWTAKNGRTATAVARLPVTEGEAVDFCVDSQGEIANDQHEWRIRLKWLEAESADAVGTTVDSAAQFHGADLTPWEAYAQALLLTNEFVFLD